MNPPDQCNVVGRAVLAVMVETVERDTGGQFPRWRGSSRLGPRLDRERAKLGPCLLHPWLQLGVGVLPQVHERAEMR